jgi:PrtD family type I secretion system ABC transporter
MKSLWQELRPMFTSLAAFSFFMNLLYLVPALFMMQVFDRVLTSNSGATLAVLLFGSAIAMLILLALDYVRNRLQNLLGTIIDERLSPPVVRAIVAKTARGAQAGHFDALRDVAALRGVFTANGLVALLDAPWVVVYVLVITLFHPMLGAGAALAAVAMLTLAWLNDRMSRKALEGLQQDGQRVSRYLESSLRNAEVLQALGMTSRLLARWREHQQRLASAQTQAGRTSVGFAAAARVLRQSIQIVMLALGAWLVLSGKASAGIMIATTVLLGRAVQPVEQLVASWRTLGEGRAAYGRLRALSDPSEDSDKARTALPRPEGGLTIHGLSYRLPGTERMALSGVILALKAGQALAVVGPSAAGKSTLARLITGIWAPTAGSVRLDGADVANWSRDELGPWIGYVPQDVELFDGTVAENIARLGDVDSVAVVAAAQRANVHEMILSLPQGYDTPVGEHGARLSPGQRQRVALARALYGDPRLVVLDEPNSNLDGAGEIALAQALSALRADGVSTVVVTHRPSLIAHVDKVLMLDGGRVHKYGPAAEVMKAMQQEAQQAMAMAPRAA